MTTLLTGWKFNLPRLMLFSLYALTHIIFQINQCIRIFLSNAPTSIYHFFGCPQMYTSQNIEVASYGSRFGYYRGRGTITKKSRTYYTFKEFSIDEKEPFTKMIGPKQQNQIFAILLDNIYLEMMLVYQIFKALFFCPNQMFIC